MRSWNHVYVSCTSMCASRFYFYLCTLRCDTGYASFIVSVHGVVSIIWSNHLSQWGIVSYSFVSLTRTHSRVVSWFVWSKLSCYSDSRWVGFISCMTDLFFFSVIVNEAPARFRSVLKSDNLSWCGWPVIVDSCDLKLSLGRLIIPAVPPLGDLFGSWR